MRRLSIIRDGGFGASRQRLGETRTVNVRSPFVAHIVDAETERRSPLSCVRESRFRGNRCGTGPARGVAAPVHTTIPRQHHSPRYQSPPASVLFAARPRLIDFRRCDGDVDQHLTARASCPAPPDTTAPELLQGHVPRESDWWAWCATLLSCATGAPFGRGRVSATMLRVLEGTLTSRIAPRGGRRAAPDRMSAVALPDRRRPHASAVGWAPGELDYVTVNGRSSSTPACTQIVNSDPQEIAAPPVGGRGTLPVPRGPSLIL